MKWATMLYFICAFRLVPLRFDRKNGKNAKFPVRHFNGDLGGSGRRSTTIMVIASMFRVHMAAFGRKVRKGVP